MAIQNFLDVTASGVNRRCEPPCVSRVGRSAAVTISVGRPAAVSWPRHGLGSPQPIAFTTNGTMPGGGCAGEGCLDGSGAVVYWVCSAGITADTFQLASTVTDALVSPTPLDRHERHAQWASV